MFTFKEVLRRYIVGSNIIIQTRHHWRIFSLPEWNNFGYKAAELAHAHDFETAKTLAAILQ